MRSPFALVLLLLASPLALGGEDARKEIVLREGVAIRAGGRGGRTLIPIDLVAARIAAGKWAAPKAGDRLTLPEGGERTWETVRAGNDGWLSGPTLAGGYLSWRVPATEDRLLVLEASGHLSVSVNGEPRAGDVYANGSVRLPVALRKGDNELLFLVGRGRLRARLVEPKGPASFDLADTTLPDLIVGEPVETRGAVLVQNATRETARGLVLSATVAGGKPVATPVPPLPPLSVRKVGFALRGKAPETAGERAVELRLTRGSETPLDTAQLKLRVRKPGDSHKVTFESVIDGSVQYYAVNPARPAPGRTAPPALFLTLHGAAVEAMGQADAYSAKSWGHLVAPTNRRPYGFDWEDWGRLDAMEVLAHAQKRLGTDPSRTYLTGHSMGGHGTWHVGVTFPDRFAAIGPSAGWISMWSYAGAVKPNQTSPLQELLSRAMAPSDTLALARNYSQHGVYVLHGSADDNVPAGQARQMKEVLEKFHRDFAYYEQPGAGHWWDASDEPGTDCVDWAPMFDFFARRVVPPPEAVRQVDFTTANPGVSARSHWASIEAQQKALRPSRVQLRCDPGARRFSGTTENVARLSLDVSHLAPGAPLAVHLDGQKLDGLAWPGKGKLWAQKEGDRWTVIAEPSRARKGPHRAGPFKDAFRHRMLFVYGTQGNAAENAWALARARYDAETFWYRGNGSVDVIADRDFDPAATRDRSVILYGHAEMNGAWSSLLAASPVQVRRGLVKVGEREEKGDDLACLFLRPRPDSDTASVGVVAGTGLAGLRVTERLSYFVSGVAYPDWVVLGLDALEKGVAGVRGAGYFGDDWGLATGESAWQSDLTR